MASRYVVVTTKSYRTLREARAAAEARPPASAAEVLKVAGYNDRCPKGADHAHASYDGDTFCPSCGQYLTVRIEKRIR